MPSRSTERSEFRGLLRFARRILIMIVALLICLPLHALWRAIGQSSPWPRLFLRTVARACGIRVRAEGVAVRQDVFYVANHLSWVDICIIGGRTGAAFVAQAPIADWPLIGWLAKLNHTVFVSRTDRMKVGGMIETLRAAIEDRQPVVIFPEGTTTDGCSLLPFKPSLFEGLVPPPRPMQVQPVLLDFGPVGPEVAWIGEESAPANAFRLLTRKGSFPVRLVYLEPFDPALLADRKAITALARDRIAAALAASLGVPALV